MEILNAYEASAFAARAAGVQLAVGNSEIMEKMKSFVDLVCRYEDSDADAAIASALSGNRVFAEKHINMSMVARTHAPMVAVSRHAPCMRDSGSLIFLPESSQELLDDVIIAYGVCESKKVSLPAIIGIDFLAAHTREMVDVPTAKVIENFIPKPAGEKLKMREVKDSIESRARMHASMENARKALDEQFEKFRKKFRRQHGHYEKFMLSDAELVVVTYGSSAGNARLAVQKMRDTGEKAGMLRLHVMRPWPDLVEALKDAKKIAVVEPSFSAGHGGILHGELADSRCASVMSPDIISVKNFVDVFSHLKKMEKPERVWMI